MRRAVLLAAGLSLCAACSKKAAQPPAPLASPPVVSAATPFAAGCNGTPLAGLVYLGSTDEPFIARDPLDEKHLIGVWQQDRWSNGGANALATAVSRDGGATWTRAFADFSHCASASAGFERASDPWVTLSPDGAAYQIALPFDGPGSPGLGDICTAVSVSRSGDGGDTWSPPVPLQSDCDSDFAIDKPTITADPADAHYVYAVWDRLTQVNNPDQALVTGPAWFTRTSDGGGTWEPPRVLYDPGKNAQTIGNQILVLPDGTLVDVAMVITDLAAKNPTVALVALRSSDRGLTWSVRPNPIAEAFSIGVADLKNGHAVRAGDLVPAVAVDPASGALYVAWADARFSAPVKFQRDGIALSRSLDGGLTWSAPAQVNGAPSVQAFLPALAVGPTGTLALTYYDFRTDDPGDADHLWTTVFEAVSTDRGLTFHEKPVGGPFDLTEAPDAGGYFVGDYSGLIPSGAGFRAFFVMANFGNAARRSDVFSSLDLPATARRESSENAASTGLVAATHEERYLHPRSVAERLRAMRERETRETREP